MICPSCRKETPGSPASCPFCGAQSPAGAAPARRWSRPAVFSFVLALASPLLGLIAAVALAGVSGLGSVLAPVAACLAGAVIALGLGVRGARQVRGNPAQRGFGLAVAGAIISVGVLLGAAAPSLMLLRLGPYGVPGAINGPVILAARDGDEATLARLLEEDPTLVRARDNLGRTPLHWAAANGNHVRSVDLLLAKGADVNAGSGGGPDVGPADLNAVVPRVGAKVKAEIAKGVTPLMCAAASEGENSEAIVALLLAKGADVNARNAWGLTAMEVAERAANHRLAELLREAGRHP